MKVQAEERASRLADVVERLRPMEPAERVAPRFLGEAMLQDENPLIEAATREGVVLYERPAR